MRFDGPLGISQQSYLFFRSTDAKTKPAKAGKSTQKGCRIRSRCSRAVCKLGLSDFYGSQFRRRYPASD